jgi:hypothetical protein
MNNFLLVHLSSATLGVLGLPSLKTIFGIFLIENEARPPAPLFNLHEYFQPVFDEVDNLNKMLDSHIGEEKREREKEMTTAIKGADNSTHACQYSSSSSLLPLISFNQTTYICHLPMHIHIHIDE